MNDSYEYEFGQSAISADRSAIKTHLLVHIQLAENLGRIQEVLVIVDPTIDSDSG